jgi:hypothetical protein
MSIYQYNADQDELLNAFDKAQQNIYGKNPYDDTYKSYAAIEKETENILLREQTVFIITSTITALLVAYTLQQL